MDTTTEVTRPTPHVTILMLTYNRAPFIRAAIDSALAQTFTNFTLIILDDGSTDETPSIVATYTDERIRYIRNDENKGLYARRRESLSYVEGNYVAILDSDDIWCWTEKLEVQVAYLEAHPDCVIIGTGFRIIDSVGTPGVEKQYKETDPAIRRRLIWQQQFANSSILMRQNAIQYTNGYQPYAPAEDYELCLQLGMQGTLANLPQIGLEYRVHGASETGKRRYHLRQIWRVVWRHRKNYHGVWRAYLKLIILYLLSFIKTK